MIERELEIKIDLAYMLAQLQSWFTSPADTRVR